MVVLLQTHIEKQRLYENFLSDLISIPWILVRTPIFLYPMSVLYLYYLLVYIDWCKDRLTWTYYRLTSWRSGIFLRFDRTTCQIWCHIAGIMMYRLCKCYCLSFVYFYFPERCMRISAKISEFSILAYFFWQLYVTSMTSCLHRHFKAYRV